VLAGIVAGHPHILYARHSDRTGKALFDLVCRKDLEGVVAKWRLGAYGQGWFKIRNSHCSAYEGRHELFRKRAAAAK
jgi:ATP-dependent DNA ligase